METLKREHSELLDQQLKTLKKQVLARQLKPSELLDLKPKAAKNQVMAGQLKVECGSDLVYNVVENLPCTEITSVSEQSPEQR